MTLKKATCEGCSKEIVWVRNAHSGAMIPMEINPHIYVVMEDEGGKLKAQRPISTGPQIGISHFITCPKADSFSRKGKKKL